METQFIHNEWPCPLSVLHHIPHCSYCRVYILLNMLFKSDNDVLYSSSNVLQRDSIHTPTCYMYTYLGTNTITIHCIKMNTTIIKHVVWVKTISQSMVVKMDPNSFSIWGYAI